MEMKFVPAAGGDDVPGGVTGAAEAATGIRSNAPRSNPVAPTSASALLAMVVLSWEEGSSGSLVAEQRRTVSRIAV